VLEAAMKSKCSGAICSRAAQGMPLLFEITLNYMPCLANTRSCHLRRVVWWSVTQVM